MDGKIISRLLCLIWRVYQPHLLLLQINKLKYLFFLPYLLFAQSNSAIKTEPVQWNGHWITAIGQKNEPNNWTAFSKEFEVNKISEEDLEKNFLKSTPTTPIGLLKTSTISIKMKRLLMLTSICLSHS